MIKITLFFNLTAVIIANSVAPRKWVHLAIAPPRISMDFLLSAKSDGTSSSGGGVEERILSSKQLVGLVPVSHIGSGKLAPNERKLLEGTIFFTEPWWWEGREIRNF